VKGQIDAPFELLVAVILMGFVLVVGFQAMQKVTFDSCVQQNDKQLEDLKTALESTINGENSRVFFSLPECAPKMSTKDGKTELVQKVSLKREGDSAICSEYCSASFNTCVLLSLYNPEFARVKCVSISPLTSFPKACDSCPEGFEAIDLFSSVDVATIPEAEYLFINITAKSASALPTVCACKRCQSKDCK